MFDLLGLCLRRYFVNKVHFGYTPVFEPRKYVGSRRNVRNLRIPFYRPVGRVRTLRVSARRLGAVTCGVPFDVWIVPLGDHFGTKTDV